VRGLDWGGRTDEKIGCIVIWARSRCEDGSGCMARVTPATHRAGAFQNLRQWCGTTRNGRLAIFAVSADLVVFCLCCTSRGYDHIMMASDREVSVVSREGVSAASRQYPGRYFRYDRKAAAPRR